MDKKVGNKKIIPYGICVFAGAFLTAVLFLLSFYVPFCDVYADCVYPYIADGLGVFMSVIPVAAGEVMMYAAIPVLILCVVFAAVPFFFRKHAGLMKICGRFYRTVLIIVILLALVYELNWFIVFRSSLLGHGPLCDRDYTLEDLRALRNYLVEEINLTAEILERDEKGGLICPGKEHIDEGVFSALNGISGEYGRLSGYCAPVKPAICSQILHSMNIGGYTYPFTMEVTYNRYVTDIYYPSLASHEECHHKGYYRENEAVFLGCLSLMKCDVPFLRYSGFITAYGYINKAYRDTLYRFYPEDEASKIYEHEPGLSKTVRTDLDLAKKTADSRYEKEKNVPQNVLDSAKEASDVGWDTQGKILDKDSYDGSVLLFLDYFAAETE